MNRYDNWNGFLPIEHLPILITQTIVIFLSNGTKYSKMYPDNLFLRYSILIFGIFHHFPLGKKCTTIFVLLLYAVRSQVWTRSLRGTNRCSCGKCCFLSTQSTTMVSHHLKGETSIAVRDPWAVKTIHFNDFNIIL